MDEVDLGILRLRVADAQQPAVVVLSGELDLSSAPAAQEAVLGTLGPAGGHPEGIAFDCAGLEFMDSSGIAMLLAVAQAHGPVELRQVTPMVRRIVEATGLQDVLRVVP